MPPAEVRVFRDERGDVPLLNWLAALERSRPKAFAKCLARILELADQGSAMRRPHADYLRDGIYELRASLAGTHYRILYFFFGKDIVALSHGIVKEAGIPSKEIELAIHRMMLVKKSPNRHTATFEV